MWECIALHLWTDECELLMFDRLVFIGMNQIGWNHTSYQAINHWSAFGFFLLG
jgi:hypothetical protein